MKSTCLWYALDKWTAEGGAMGLVHSMHWCIPHVHHRAIGAARPTQFVPLADLRWPWLSLLGFEGHVLEGDEHEAERGPVHPLCMLLGTFLLGVSGACWCIHRAIKKLRKSS